MSYVTSQTVTGVTARVGNFGGTPIDMEDGGSAILDLSGGGLATFTGGYWHPRWLNDIQWNLRGTQRWVHWDPSRTPPAAYWKSTDPNRNSWPWRKLSSYLRRHTRIRRQGDGRPVARLGRCAHEGGDCRNTPESMVAVLETIDRIYESSRPDGAWKRS